MDSTDIPLINILTRSGKRKDYFKRLKKSIVEQSYKNVRHIVSCDQPNCKFLQNEEVVFVKKEPDKGKCFYNLYLNQLTDQVNDGWVIVLDDDSKLIKKKFLEKLAKICASTQKNKVIIYRSKCHRVVLPPRPKIMSGYIDMCCFCAHHSVFKDIQFDSRCYGDFNFLQKVKRSKQYSFRFCSKIPIGIHGNYDGHRDGK